MKHLIETANPSGLAITEYDRIILNSTTNDVIVGGGVTYEYVDLGLSVKWAKCNVGAKTETDYGSYFMWGSTRPNTADECTWENAPFLNGPSNKFTKYCTDSSYGAVDNKTTLEFVDDAARVIMGGNWRMPTNDECRELINGTTNEWTKVNGVDGWKFTSSNGNSIFIPAAGAYSGGSADLVGECGFVWSSSLYASGPGNACNLYFYSDSCYVDYGSRYYGVSVRGVCE